MVSVFVKVSIGSRFCGMVWNLMMIVVVVRVVFVLMFNRFGLVRGLCMMV